MYILLPQDAQCGEGTRVRNISCVVFDGSIEDVGKIVDEEFCGEIEPIIDGNKKMILEETCTVPCPGKRAIQINITFQDCSVYSFQITVISVYDEPQAIKYFSHTLLIGQIYQMTI